MFRHCTIGLVLLAVVCPIAAGTVQGEESRFAKTHSRSDYVHWIDLYDADGRRIDPTAENGPPYSPQQTCGRCHDYQAIVSGHHFNALDEVAPSGRPGEPWIWTDERTGTQIPVSYRGWKGTYDPGELGISAREFVLKFGRHLPGGGPGEAPPGAPEPAAEQDGGEEGQENGQSEAAAEANRWELSGLLNVDCMMCHSAQNNYNREAWWKQIEEENFAWAATAALGLGKVDGRVASLPDDFDPAAAEDDPRYKMPETTYTFGPLNAENQVFIDIVRTPSNNACYYCHSTRPVGEDAPPEWTRDEDVHLRAGFQCADCHPNGIAHHTVRGYEGEVHPTGEDVGTLSCRGCHMDDRLDEHEAGRMGAPKPLHKGLPPLHLEVLSCTACHSGPMLDGEAKPMETAMAHALGLPSHRGEIPPGIKSPVMLRERDVLYPHRAVWPAFWGEMVGDTITPLNPEEVYDATRRTFRVRRGSSLAEVVEDVRLSPDERRELLGEERAAVDEQELTEEEKNKLDEALAERVRENWNEMLTEALTALEEIVTQQGAQPVYVSAGKVYRLADEQTVESLEHEAAEPYYWKIGHDVRPARQSLGVKSCYECHTPGAPLFESTVTAVGQIPEQEGPHQAMYELAGYDKTKLDAWALSFTMGRTPFKYFAFAAMGVVALVILAYTLRGIIGLLSFASRGR